jgi:hypothetical protein
METLEIEDLHEGSLLVVPLRVAATNRPSVLFIDNEGTMRCQLNVAALGIEQPWHGWTAIGVLCHRVSGVEPIGFRLWLLLTISIGADKLHQSSQPIKADLAVLDIILPICGPDDGLVLFPVDSVKGLPLLALLIVARFLSHRGRYRWLCGGSNLDERKPTAGHFQLITVLIDEFRIILIEARPRSNSSWL